MTHDRWHRPVLWLTGNAIYQIFYHIIFFVVIAPQVFSLAGLVETGLSSSGSNELVGMTALIFRVESYAASFLSLIGAAVIIAKPPWGMKILLVGLAIWLFIWVIWTLSYPTVTLFVLLSVLTAMSIGFLLIAKRKHSSVLPV